MHGAGAALGEGKRQADLCPLHCLMLLSPAAEQGGWEVRLMVCPVQGSRLCDGVHSPRVPHQLLQPSISLLRVWELGAG